MEMRRIVDSMSPKDIMKLYVQEIPFVNHKLEELGKKFKKLINPDKADTRFFSPIEFKRKSGLNIVLQYFDRGNKYPRAKRMGIILYFWFRYNNGISAIRPLLDPQYGIIPYFYTSHFIQRYIERELKDNSITKPEALNIFLRNNPKTVMKYKPSISHPDNGWLCKNQGLCFVEVKPDSTVLMKTFLPWKDLNFGQISGSADMINEAIEKGLDFPVPDNLLEDSDVIQELWES